MQKGKGFSGRISFTFDGDAEAAEKWMPFATNYLKSLANSGIRHGSIAPEEGVLIEADTITGRVHLQAGSSSASVYIAPMFGQVPDDSATTYQPGMPWPHINTGGYPSWDSVPFTVGIIQGYTIKPSSVATTTTLYKDQFTTPYFSTLDKPVDIDSIKPKDKYGSRGFADEYLNHVWTGANKLSVNASWKLFKNEASYLAIIGNDSRAYNWTTAISELNVIDHSPPLALGAYIGDIFYAYPSSLTSISPNAVKQQCGFWWYSAAARPSSGTILTAVASDATGNDTVGWIGGGGVSGYSKLVLGLSTLKHPTLSETFKPFGVDPQTVKTNGTLNVKNSVEINITENFSYGTNAVIVNVEFSPDAKFLYVGMYLSFTPNTDFASTGTIYFAVRRWLVYKGGSTLSLSGVATIYISPDYLEIPGKFRVPVGGFRCQQVSKTKHVYGFCRHDVDGAVSSQAFVNGFGHGSTFSGITSALVGVTINVDANPYLPLDANPIEGSVDILPMQPFDGVRAFFDGNNIYYADYIRNTFIYSNLDMNNYRYTTSGGNVLGSYIVIYYKPIMYLDGTNHTFDMSCYQMQGLNVTLGYGFFVRTVAGTSNCPMIHNTLGNRCALSPDNKYLYMFGLVDNSTNMPGGDSLRQKIVLAKIDLKTGSAVISDSPTGFLSKYIVTSNV